MKKLMLDPVTEQAAQEYADNEADLMGFAKDSAKWERAFLEFCSRAVSGLSVGRNPRAKKNPVGGGVVLLEKVVEYMNRRLLAGADFRRLEAGALMLATRDRVYPLMSCKGKIVRGETVYVIVRVRKGQIVSRYSLLKGKVTDVGVGSYPVFSLDTEDGTHRVLGNDLYAVGCFREPGS